jgi:hypothetical protein
MCASNYGHFTVVKLLLQNGANVGEKVRLVKERKKRKNVYPFISFVTNRTILAIPQWIWRMGITRKLLYFLVMQSNNRVS